MRGIFLKSNDALETQSGPMSYFGSILDKFHCLVQFVIA